MFRGFEPGAFKLVKISIQKFKCFFGVSNKCSSEWLSRMLPLSYTRKYNIIGNTTYSINEDT